MAVYITMIFSEQTLFTMDGDKLVQTQTAAKGKNAKFTREFTDTHMIMVRPSSMNCRLCRSRSVVVGLCVVFVVFFCEAVFVYQCVCLFEYLSSVTAFFFQSFSLVV